MPAVRYDLTIEQGATFTVTFEWHEGTATGPLIDTADYIPRMQIRTRLDGVVMATLTAGAGITATGGVIQVRIGADVTETFVAAGAYDLELIDAGDPTEVVRLAEGVVNLHRGGVMAP